ncbi:hypothetical protein K504DRAFT_260436 [Pleomassaria siparia CBS 279.74]|uniref:Chromo domain-containing protein n=1 Tax=Pleomassaria siparia CBS 279.74 TaxID=1314801 RepID=A0A6G1KC36_9PLEO|nr:hypothetical protein K504DRAFT_260436 [Pleomassaria siparia CBS 279.74]
MRWSWETYKPAPEIYNDLWRIRKEPPTITRNLSNECPIPNAQSRIAARRQTEDGRQRNFYVVKVQRNIYGEEESSHGDTYMHGTSKGQDQKSKEETVEVDMSVILRYVSIRELERFENSEFRAEAEAEAAMKQHETDELTRHRLEKNARGVGMGRGSGMLDGYKGRGKGRGRGRGRGRGGSGAMRPEDLKPGGLESGEDGTAMPDMKVSPSPNEEETLQRAIPETESEGDEDDGGKQRSPDLMRTAFVANSALPTSPVALHRRLSIVHRGQPEVPDLDESDMVSMSSAAEQLFTERRMREPSEEEDSEDDTRHRSKRPRTESTSSIRKPLVHRNTSTAPRVMTDLRRQQAIPQPPSEASSDSEEVSEDEDIPIHTIPDTVNIEDESEDGDNVTGESDHNEYVVEKIFDDSRPEGVQYYHVKWAGYEDATDWLREDELENVKELIEEYENTKRSLEERSGRGKARQGKLERGD